MKKFIIVYIEFPKADNQDPGLTISEKGVVHLQVDQTNLAAFLGDATFVKRLHAKIEKVNLVRKEILLIN